MSKKKTTRKNSKEITKKSDNKLYKILKDSANILTETFETIDQAKEFIKVQQERDALNTLVCSYRVIQV